MHIRARTRKRTHARKICTCGRRGCWARFARAPTAHRACRIDDNKIHFYALSITKCYKRWHVSFHRATKPSQSNLFCKLYFTKFTKFSFFLIRIRYNSQKCIIFAADLKNGTKLLHFFQINK